MCILPRFKKRPRVATRFDGTGIESPVTEVVTDSVGGGGSCSQAPVALRGKQVFGESVSGQVSLMGPLLLPRRSWPGLQSLPPGRGPTQPLVSPPAPEPVAVRAGLPGRRGCGKGPSPVWRPGPSLGGSVGRTGLGVSLLSLPRQGPGGQDVCSVLRGCRCLQRDPARAEAGRRREPSGVRGAPPHRCGSEGAVGGGGGLAQARTEGLPAPQADGSNFRSRGAGLNCPARRGPKSVSRKQPHSHMFKARCSSCLCLFKDAAAQGQFLTREQRQMPSGRRSGGGPAAVIAASRVPGLSLAWGTGGGQRGPGRSLAVVGVFCYLLAPLPARWESLHLAWLRTRGS